MPPVFASYVCGGSTSRQDNCPHSIAKALLCSVTDTYKLSTAVLNLHSAHSLGPDCSACFGCCAQWNAVSDPAKEKAERERAEEARIRATEQLERRQVRHSCSGHALYQLLPPPYRPAGNTLFLLAPPGQALHLLCFGESAVPSYQ